MLLTALKSVQQRQKIDGDTEAAIVGLFTKAKDTPQVIAGLQYFFLKEVRVSDFASSNSERKSLKKAVRTATDTLALLSSATAAAE